MPGAKHPQHAVRGCSPLLHGWIPLAEDSLFACGGITCLSGFANGKNIRNTRAHSMIHLHAAPTGDAALLHKINGGFNTNRRHDNITGYTRAIFGADAEYLPAIPLLPDDLGNFLFDANINPILLFLVQY